MMMNFWFIERLCNFRLYCTTRKHHHLSATRIRRNCCSWRRPELRTPKEYAKEGRAAPTISRPSRGDPRYPARHPKARAFVTSMYLVTITMKQPFLLHIANLNIVSSFLLMSEALEIITLTRKIAIIPSGRCTQEVILSFFIAKVHWISPDEHDSKFQDKHRRITQNWATLWMSRNTSLTANSDNLGSSQLRKLTHPEYPVIPEAAQRTILIGLDAISSLLSKGNKKPVELFLLKFQHITPRVTKTTARVKVVSTSRVVSRSRESVISRHPASHEFEKVKQLRARPLAR
ncbi:hypothetical protein J6590_032144 [Homalodisca vitripennis]|nr:hypothetical protein J6590_032144 [Homalodisca vitripennis]